ncbi:MAG: methyltransferase domain-containing protein [Mycobacteriales bacterium]
MPEYALSNQWEREAERLDALTAWRDPGSLQFCRAAGLTEGWRCLEIGPGTGRFAQALADAVGDRGQVLAVDIDPSLALARTGRTYEVAKVDVRVDELPPGPFELVHARMVVMHLPDRRALLSRLAAVLDAGGVLVSEDLDNMTAICEPPSAIFTKVMKAIFASTAAAGSDSNYGRRLPGDLRAIGLEDVVTECSVRATFADPVAGLPALELLLDQLEGRVLAQDGISPADLTAFRALLRDGSSTLFAPTLVRARGRRP